MRTTLVPELPEAEVILAQLRREILGARIQACWIGRADIIREGLSTLPWYKGARINQIQRKGKSILITCGHGEQQRYLVAELGMTGLLLLKDLGASYHKHTHMVLSLQGGQASQLRYWNARRFGRVYLLTANELTGFLTRRFGKDPLTMSEAEFADLVRSCRGRVKALLLHQQKLAGIGNIYANEILHRAGVHPHAWGSQLSRPTLCRLYTAMQTVLREAISCGGSTIQDFRAPDGTCGCFQKRHRVYQKAGTLCPRGCGACIRRLRTERSSFYCALCQKRT